MSFTVQQLEGIMPALHTAYHPDGSVNVDVIRKLAASHVEQGCNGFFLCGSTGEGLLMSLEERKLIARTVIETVAGQVPVMVHVGAVSTNDSVELAKDAKRAGAAAVSTLPPIYYRPGLPGLMQHLRAIASVGLPTSYYHIPVLTGLDFSAQELVDALTSIDGVFGLKFTHSELFTMWWILDAAKGRLRVFNGWDQMLLQGLVTGACGGVGSTYNYQMKTIVGIYKAVKAGDFETARKLQWKANEVIRVLFRNGGNLATEKAILKLRGFEVGPPRGPLVPFPEERLGDLRRQLEEIHFFD